MSVLKPLLIFVAAAFYLAYLICAVPLGVICGCAVYALGLPIAYLVSLRQVLVVRPPELTDPSWWPTPGRRRRPRGDAVLLRTGPRGRRARRTSRLRQLPETMAVRLGCYPMVLRYWPGATQRATGRRRGARDSGGHRVRCGRHGRLRFRSVPGGRDVRPALSGSPGPSCAALTQPSCGSRTSGWSARTATSGSPTRRMSAPAPIAPSVTGTCGRAGSALCSGTAVAARQWTHCCSSARRG